MKSAVPKLLLGFALALFAAPLSAFADGQAEPSVSDKSFFANGTPITITEDVPSGAAQSTISGTNNIAGTSAYVSWEYEGATYYLGVSKDATVYGGGDGSASKVVVPNTSIVMTGGRIWNLFGGNLGKKSKVADECSEVTGDVSIKVSGKDSYVSNLFHGGGAFNSCVKGTVAMEFDGVDFCDDSDPAALSPYVNGGVYGNGSEGSRDIDNGTMQTYAVANNVEIAAKGSEFYLLGAGGSGSTKVVSGSVKLDGCKVDSLYLGGINGEVCQSNLELGGCTVANLSGTNRGFVGNANVEIKSTTISQLNTGAEPYCMQSDSGTPDAAGVTGKMAISIDAGSTVTSAALTPLVTRKKDSTTAVYPGLIIKAPAESPLALSMKPFEANSTTKIAEAALPEGSVLDMENVKLSIAAESVFVNAGTIQMDSSSSITVDESATFSDAGGTVSGGTLTGEVSKPVAKIGNQVFSSLQEAINAAAAGEKVVLLVDTEENVEVGANSNITINLNGCTLNGKKANGKPAIKNAGTLIIEDSSADMTGVIKREENGETSAYYVIDNAGTLTINGGTVYNNSGDNAAGASLIRNFGSASQSAKLVVNGGKLQQDNFICIKNDDYSILEVNGGEIISASNQAIQNWDEAKITGGQIKGQVITWSYTTVPNNATMAITGGHIDGPVQAINYYENGAAAQTAPKVTISEEAEILGRLGTYTHNGGKVTATQDESLAKMTVSGGRFAISVAERYLSDDIKAELKSATNTVTPYSYYTDMNQAIEKAAPGDSITAVNNSEDATLVTITFKFNDGKTPDAAYKVLKGANGISLPTPERSGYTFGGWFDGTAKVNDPYTATADVELNAKWSSNSVVVPPTPSDKTEVVKNPDGSTTTTVTKPDGSQTITHETATGTESVVKKDKDGNVTSAEVTVSKQDAASGKVELPLADAEPAADASKAPEVEVKVPSTVTADKPVQVTVPVAGDEGDEPDYGIVVFAVDAEGNETLIPKCTVDDNGNVVFEATGNMTIKVVDNAKDMPDVKDTDWFAGDVVDFATARGIVNGVDMSDGAKQFQGYGRTSRGMFVAMLHNLELNPEAASDASLPDVPEDAFYADAAAWALEEGILSGVDMPDGSKQFLGNADVTREQVAVFLMRYADHLGMDVSKRAEIDFPDANEVSSYAKDAMSLAVANGLFTGDDATGELNPTDGAARAEVATVLMRFINLMYA